jgi:hypothetical protein
MELQFFDSTGVLRFNFYGHEPLWPVLGVGAGPIEGEELRALVERLEAEVRRLRAALPAQPEAGGYDEATVEVLGEALRLNVRNPAHEELLRANRIHASVQDVLRSGLTLRAIAKPELSREQFRVAWLLKNTADAIPKRALPALVESKLDELRSSATNRSVVTALDAERERWADPSTPERTVAELAASGLVREDDDGIVRPTEDLCLLRM